MASSLEDARQELQDWRRLSKVTWAGCVLFTFATLVSASAGWAFFTPILAGSALTLFVVATALCQVQVHNKQKEIDKFYRQSRAGHIA